jgi:vancomycin permeability regulator SanA
VTERRSTAWRRREPVIRRVLWVGLALGLVGSIVVGAPLAWTRASASGHIFDESGVASAPVVIVFGAELRPDASSPKPILAGRLDLTVRLVQSGKARAVLVSGDGRGSSGDEVSVMTEYLIARGVDPARIATDPYGLDTFDTCRRAHDVFGVDRAILATQSFHLYRAVTLCRFVGIDAAGVPAGCDACPLGTLIRNRSRDALAGVKAALDVARDRPPAVESPPSRAIADILARP